MSSFEYLPYDDGTQPSRQIEGYPRSFSNWSDRRRLVAVRDETFDVAGVTGYRFDIVLRGEDETPFFVD